MSLKICTGIYEWIEFAGDIIHDESKNITIGGNSNDNIEITINKNIWSISKRELNLIISNLGTAFVREYKIIGASVICRDIYIFIQIGYQTSSNGLCVIKGDSSQQNQTNATNTFKLHSYYNIFSVARRNHIIEKRCMTMKIERIMYDKYGNVLVALIKVRGRAMIGIIDYLDSMRVLGSSFNLVMKDNEVLCIGCEPIALGVVDRNVKQRPEIASNINKERGLYRLTVYDERMRCEKMFGLRIALDS